MVLTRKTRAKQAELFATIALLPSFLFFYSQVIGKTPLKATRDRTPDETLFENQGVII
ncbi:MAG: hypothetical protein ACOC41_09365 [Chitinivibrionales bacterium]